MSGEQDVVQAATNLYEMKCEFFILKTRWYGHVKDPVVARYFPKEMQHCVLTVPDAHYIMGVEYSTEVQMGITGKIECGETVLQATERELCEELKLVFKCKPSLSPLPMYPAAAAVRRTPMSCIKVNISELKCAENNMALSHTAAAADTGRRRQRRYKGFGKIGVVVHGKKDELVHVLKTNYLDYIDNDNITAIYIIPARPLKKRIFRNVYN